MSLNLSESYLANLSNKASTTRSARTARTSNTVSKKNNQNKPKVSVAKSGLDLSGLSTIVKNTRSFLGSKKLGRALLYTSSIAISAVSSYFLFNESCTTIYDV